MDKKQIRKLAVVSIVFLIISFILAVISFILPEWQNGKLLKPRNFNHNRVDDLPDGQYTYHNDLDFGSFSRGLLLKCEYYNDLEDYDPNIRKRAEVQ